MAKKRKKTRKLSNKEPKGSAHSLEGGFWQQIGAVVMVVLAVFFVLSWFGAGGPVLEWLSQSVRFLIGHAIYLIPLLLVYLAVMVFRSDNNRIPGVVKVASCLVVLWFTGIFGLFKNSEGEPTGGALGDIINKAMLAVASEPVAILIYLLLIFITALFVLGLSPATLFRRIVELFRSDSIDREDQKNAKVMNQDQTDDKEGKLEVVGGVPIAKKTSSEPAEAKSDDRPPKALMAVSDPNWQMPPVDLLESHQDPADPGDVNNNAEVIKRTLAEFDITVKMEKANVGPKVTQYTLKPDRGVKLSRISGLEKELARALAAKHIRVEAPIPGQSVVGIEVPNIKAADVRLRGVMESSQWKRAGSKLSFAIGRDISGKAVLDDLGEMPHLLIAGQTKSGKSVMINTLLCSLLYRNSPSDMKLILIDPKLVELSRYRDIPHLLTPVITDVAKTVSALKWAVNEMERRYSLLAEAEVVNIDDYNEKMVSHKPSEPKDDAETEADLQEGAMPYIVVVVDEMADLMMMAAKDLEALIVRLAQKARAVGIHLVLATQSPRADVVTGLIKANIPATIAFTVHDGLESRIIMGHNGAEKLLGKGDMLLSTSEMPVARRIQGAWTTNNEVRKIVEFLREQSGPQYNDDIVAQPVDLNGRGGVVMDFGVGSGDESFKAAVQLALETRKISTSLLQRKLRLGFPKASRIIDEMEEKGIIGPANGSKPRDVLISDIDELE
jgi:S-DNA-T family DNA segregation ATPase FtsK/SpoIIIE